MYNDRKGSMGTESNKVISKDLCKIMKCDLRLEKLSLDKIFHVIFLYILSVCVV